MKSDQTQSFRQRRKFMELVGTATLCSLPQFVFAQGKQTPLSVLINRTGKIRALSQRASKFYVQSILGVLAEKAAENVQATQRAIGSSIEFLLASGPPPEMRSLITTLERDAAALSTMLGGSPKKEDTLVVVRAADAVLESADKATKAYQEASKQGAARIVNLSGRQRMLSQRAARAYFLVAAGNDTPVFRKQLTDSVAEFKDGLGALQATPLATPSIKNEIELARSQWILYETALSKKPTPESLTTVATTSERLFEVMDNLTSLYDTAVRDLLG